MPSFMDVDTSYQSNQGYLCNTTDFESTQLRSPKRALTMDLPSRLRFPPPASEQTPPPSPPATRSAPVTESNTSRFAPLLNRASSVLSRRQSISPHRRSPTRELPPSPLRSPVHEHEPDMPSRDSSEQSTRSNATKATKAAIAFSDFFQGSSELVSGFGTSPKRDNDSYTRSRAGHSRNSSTVSVANFFGRASPARRVQNLQEDKDDKFLTLEIDRELFPQGEPMDIGIADYDELRSNAERLFMQMQMAYEVKVEALQMERIARSQQQDDMDGLRTQNEHLKVQLRGMAEESQEQAESTWKLQLELKKEKQMRQAEQEMRIRSVRVVSEEPKMSFAGVDGHEFTLDDAYCSEGGSGSESLGGSTFWSRPESRSSCSQSDAEEAAGAIGRLTFGGTGSVRDENSMLKARVAELEAAVDGCLGLVHGL